MKPETRTVTQLFEPDVRFIVSLYQRPRNLADTRAVYPARDRSSAAPVWSTVTIGAQ